MSNNAVVGEAAGYDSDFSMGPERQEGRAAWTSSIAATNLQLTTMIAGCFESSAATRRAALTLPRDAVIHPTTVLALTVSVADATAAHESAMALRDVAASVESRLAAARAAAVHALERATAAPVDPAAPGQVPVSTNTPAPVSINTPASTGSNNGDASPQPSTLSPAPHLSPVDASISPPLNSPATPSTPPTPAWANSPMDSGDELPSPSDADGADDDWPVLSDDGVVEEMDDGPVAPAHQDGGVAAPPPPLQPPMPPPAPVFVNLAGDPSSTPGPLSRADYDRLPFFRLPANNPQVREKRSCIICREEFKEGDTVMILQCMHFCHRGEDCLTTWLRRHSGRCMECSHPVDVHEGVPEIQFVGTG